MQFGDILRWLIEENDLTQKQLSESLNIAPSTVANYVNNLREPDFQTLRRIADYFHVSIDYLLGHHLKQGENDLEDDLLQAFRSLPPAQQRIFLEQSRAVAKLCAGDKA